MSAFNFGPPFWNRFAGGTVPNATTFNETVTFNKTAESGQETVATFKVSDEATAKLSILNASGTGGVFIPSLEATSDGANQALLVDSVVSTDSGSLAAIQFNSRLGAGGAVTTRPLFELRNNNTAVLSALPLNSGANLCLSWGTQAAAGPGFTTRSTGTRLVLFNALSGSAVDCAIGIESGAQWYSVNQASSSYSHKFYAGTSNIASFRGDGAFISTGSQIVKFRVATTTPITVASGTDYIIGSNMTVAGAVAVSIPGAAPAGMMFHIKDVKGDAGSNTITITPTIGTIDGAANKTITSNFGTLQVISDGTNYFTL